MCRRKQAFLLFLWICFTNVLFGQYYVLKNDIPVLVNGDTLEAAWAGGLNSPQFSEMDLDLDNKMDLVVFDRLDNELLTFINKGTPGNSKYEYAPEYQRLFPSNLNNWVLTRDYNGDGKMDIFTSVPGSSYIRVYKNTSTSLLQFAVAKDTVRSFYPPSLYLYSSFLDIPGLEDVDSDGDIDILTFHVFGIYIEWHKNLSMENFGDKDHLEFEVQSHCFGHFMEDQMGCNAFLDTLYCGAGEREQFQGPVNGKILHAGSTILALDMSGDSLYEIVIGDVSCNSLYLLQNSGTKDIAHFGSMVQDFPSSTISVDIPVFPAAFYLDLDNDGIKDFVAAPNETSLCEDRAGVWFYRNIGTNSQPDFSFVKTGFLQDRMIETGSGTMPELFDHNGDGLIDLLVGNYGRFDSIGGFRTSFSLFENVGTLQQPVFELLDDNYLNFAFDPMYSGLDFIAPETGDLDGDGDPDLLVGNYDGDLIYFENVAGAGNTAVFASPVFQYKGIDVGLFSSPELYDIDGDSDLDLLIGNLKGYIYYYRNIGTPNFPVFTMVTDSFGGVKINDETGQSFSNGAARPRMVDFDNDSNVELLVGGKAGEITIFENVSGIPGAVFANSGKLYQQDFGLYTSLAASKLDSSKWSYVVGNFRGGLHLLRDGNVVKTPDSISSGAISVSIWPNPVHSELNIHLDLMDEKGRWLYQVFSSTGEMVVGGAFRGKEEKISISNLSPGLYFIRINDGRNFVIRKFIKL